MGDGGVDVRLDPCGETGELRSLVKNARLGDAGANADQSGF